VLLIKVLLFEEGYKIIPSVFKFTVLPVMVLLKEEDETIP
jgi:hypothetical protein